MITDSNRILVGGTDGQHSLTVALELESLGGERLVYDRSTARLGAWVRAGHTDRVIFFWCGWMSGKTARTVASRLNQPLWGY